MQTNKYYKGEALRALKGNWTPAVLATIVFFAVYFILYGPGLWQTAKLQDSIATINPSDFNAVMAAYKGASGASSLQLLGQVFLLFPLSLGLANAFRLLLASGDNNLTSNMFSIAFSNYWHKVWGMLLMDIFIFLWSLLLVIPGIIKCFSYAMTPYILQDNPELSANEAIDRSRAMMKGHKFDLFYLYLSFIGWFFLCILTAGIGFLWLHPYVQAAEASFYEDLKTEFYGETAAA